MAARALPKGIKESERGGIIHRAANKGATPKQIRQLRALGKRYAAGKMGEDETLAGAVRGIGVAGLRASKG
jgi:hypothetical protein